MAAKTVDEYINGLEGWKRDVAAQVRAIVTTAAPEAREVVKWAQAVYEVNGPLAYIKAFKNSINFGFWRGVDIDDPQGLLQGSGEKMRHVKLTSAADVDAEAFTAFVKQAVRLNLDKGDPTKG
ncbi:MAG: DUF1801 domain-containing protein [Chloroflexota bacterium]